MRRVPTLPLPQEIETVSTVVDPVAPVIPAGSAALSAEPGVVHVVEPGQTLWRIARTYGVPLAILARTNAIDDPTQIAVGQNLRIPGAFEPLSIPPFPAPLALPSDESAVRAGFTWPIVGGEILSHFGVERRSGRHAGIDIRGERGQAVLAAQSGQVIFSGDGMRGYGKTVMLDHGDGWISLYAHNSALLVGVGDFVERGQIIAEVGRTGNATTEHCHFEIRQGARPVDPLQLLEPLRGALR